MKVSGLLSGQRNLQKGFLPVATQEGELVFLLSYFPLKQGLDLSSLT